ncbi:hypothetical protein Q3A66_05195 [Hymenobacter sp. BT770]|uniref:hypothetical protein n=1 Tax=Hymenobacter sp. BT770 TaxID=2886942 RepID=UPI001D115E9E|nr:hypothetical protein [Hymenobacter sp. BT770]MCC3152569.1 hypothetical protein [Hymenobacter sp. BT770]MDO3414454.1 hypothetical protein [Hymenobacter sp. BT770]
MRPFFIPLPNSPRRLVMLALGLAVSGCASRRFFQPDARIGPGSTEALPAAADSVRVVAGRHYNRHSGLYCLIWGRHYRAVWAAPATVPVLHLATAAPGGLKADKPGGGYQSISMSLAGSQGREYALRALDKEPSRTLPKVLRNTFVLNAVRDATSATIPYGALTVPPFAQAVGVPHTRPRLVYVRQDETGLGSMSARFQGKVALLEEKYEALASRTPDLANATEFLGGEDMLKKVYTHPSYAIDQPAFLRARLLDVWLGDWDRHEGQWTWAAFQENGGRVRYRAIPKDRDQVYFLFDDGLMPWLASRRFIAPQFHTFKPSYGYVPGLVKQAIFIDQRGLSQMTRADFLRMAADLQRRLPDSLIDRAMHRLPPAVFALEGPRIGSALKTRRQTLSQAAEAFYLSLAREPVLGGTAQAERFVVHRYRDSTTVRVFSPVLGKLTPGDSLRFRRTYFTTETHELSLDGLGGDDVFEVTSTGAGKPITLLLYGGAGHDQLHLQGNGRRLKVFDEASDMTAAAASRPQLPKKKRRAYDRLNDD